MSVFVELKYKDKKVGQIKVSDCGFVFMTDYSRPELGQQNYSYFNQTSCPVWDEVKVRTGETKMEPKTKTEIIEELEQIIVTEESHNMCMMDALSGALDYINNSEDGWAKMAELAKAHEEGEI